MAKDQAEYFRPWHRSPKEHGEGKVKWTCLTRTRRPFTQSIFYPALRRMCTLFQAQDAATAAKLKLCQELTSKPFAMRSPCSECWSYSILSRPGEAGRSSAAPARFTVLAQHARGPFLRISKSTLTSASSAAVLVTSSTSGPRIESSHSFAPPLIFAKLLELMFPTSNAGRRAQSRHCMLPSASFTSCVPIPALHCPLLSAFSLPFEDSLDAAVSEHRP